MNAIRLKTEHLFDPLGIDVQRPRLTWNAEGGVKQRAYEIVTDKWQSGKVESGEMHAAYPLPLTSRERVNWKVRLWDENDQPGDWAQAFFEMGLLTKDDWTAQWITGDYTPFKKERYPADCFRKAFTLEKPVSSARLYATACGLYEARLGGKKVGDFVMAPGYTDYRKRVQYQTYDVTKMLHEGENELCIRIYNNNSFGGFYDRTMALVSTREAVSYLKGLPTDALNSTAAYEAFVAKQVAALESKDIEAYKATLFDNYNENEVDKQEKLLQVLDWFAKYDSIDVADANGGFYRYNDCDVYYASRTITGTKDGESVVLFNNAEFVEYLTKDGDAVKERGNWSHCYIVSYTSTLTGMNNTTQKYGVYLPPSYYTSPEKTYPVVYLLQIGRAHV